MNVESKLYLTGPDGRRIFGPGPAELLEHVDRCGSLRSAALEMGLSYSKALKMIRRAEQGLTSPLLSSESGGNGGGRSAITPQARQLLDWFSHCRQAAQTAVEAQMADGFPWQSPHLK